MKTLFQLAKLNENNLKIIELLLPTKSEESIKKLLDILFSGQIINDTQAMISIYGYSNLATFSRLKSKVKDLLIKTLILRNSDLESDHSRINESLNQFRHTIVTRVLIDKKMNNLAIEIAKRALVKSIKYYSTENVLSLSRILIRHYSTSEFNGKKLKLYLEIQQKYLNIHAWEIKSENYYRDLYILQNNTFEGNVELLKEKARKYCEELNSTNDIKTYLYFINRYKVNAAYFEIQRDYESLLKLCNKTIKELSTPELKTNLVLQGINLRKIWALIQAGRNIEAINIGIRDMKKLPTGSIAWYYRVNYVLKAYLYNADYRSASDLIKSAIENQLFAKLSKNFQELFYTILGYIHLINDAGYVLGIKHSQNSLPEFKIGKFLNNIPVFSKDKRGINVSILLMHVAILLQRKHYDKIIDRIDSLNQYAYKYLRKDDTFRSNCMIKMVIQMAKADFNPIRTERYTRDLLKQLEQVKLAGSGENIETEIIPYEVLWAIMKKALL